jgi:hypothetical protein
VVVILGDELCPDLREELGGLRRGQEGESADEAEEGKVVVFAVGAEDFSLPLLDGRLGEPRRGSRSTVVSEISVQRIPRDSPGAQKGRREPLSTLTYI